MGAISLRLVPLRVPPSILSPRLFAPSSYVYLLTKLIFRAHEMGTTGDITHDLMLMTYYNVSIQRRTK